jgi:hypothetical protein
MAFEKPVPERLNMRIMMKNPAILFKDSPIL